MGARHVPNGDGADHDDHDRGGERRGESTAHVRFGAVRAGRLLPVLRPVLLVTAAAVLVKTRHSSPEAGLVLHGSQGLRSVFSKLLESRIKIRLVGSLPYRGQGLRFISRLAVGREKL